MVYEKLVTYFEALDTMGKLKLVNSYVRLTLGKLPTYLANLPRVEDDW